jgi:hypothetical protein
MTMLSLVHGVLNGMQDFRTAEKILNLMNALDDQQLVKHLI